VKLVLARLPAFDRERHARVLGVWSLFVAALLCAVAFASYVPRGYDGEDAAAANLVGPPGRLLSWVLVETFGVGAFGLPFFLTFLGWRLRTRPAVSDPLLKVVGVPMLLFTIGLLVQTLLPGRHLARTQFPLGGVLGEHSAELLLGHFGLQWSLLLAGAGLAASLVLTTDTFLIEPFLPQSVKNRRAAKAAEAAAEKAAEKASAAAERAARAGVAVAEKPVEKPAEKPAAPAKAKVPPVRSGTEETVADRIAARRRAAAALEARTSNDEAAAVAAAAAAAPVESDAGAATESSPKRRAPAKAPAEKPAHPLAPPVPPEAALATSDDEGDDDAPPPPKSRRAKPARKPVEERDEESDAPSADASADAANDDDEEDTDDFLADDAPPPEPRAEQRELPFKPPKIRDLAAPSRADGGSVTVINLLRDPKLKGKEKYDLPPLTLLAEPKYATERETDQELQDKAQGLTVALNDFGVTAEVEEVVRGPVITRYDLKMERGTRISRVTALAEDLAMSLGAERVRIAQVKGKSALGVEIPNKYRETVWLREIALAVSEAQQKKIAIPLFLGKDSSGRPIIEDLATMPHLLVAGRTGAGKSVFINSMILSILLTRYPEEVRLIMIDPKKVELEIYQDIPHLLTRVESDPKKAQAILDWAVQQMEERYALLSCTGVRHLRDYNRMDRGKRTELLKKHYSDGEIEKLPETMPYVVIIVDELADLMMASGRAVEQSIARLAQKARAVGIHVVVATQRPSVDVITGLIKANMPSRIAFQTKSGIDSRTILDSMGAEKLLDKGDMLYSSSASGDAPTRAQGPFVSDDEVHAVVDYLREHAAPLYTHHLIQVGAGELKGAGGDGDEEEDDRFGEAVETVLETKQASASWLQRHLGLGYARASRIVDRMTELGYISGPNGSKPREILITLEQWNAMKGKIDGASAAEAS
jgi:S-DNA-T family DNA segregation ATPase FtsK/SpoIIIE